MTAIVACCRHLAYNSKIMFKSVNNDFVIFLGYNNIINVVSEELNYIYWLLQFTVH